MNRRPMPVPFPFPSPPLPLSPPFSLRACVDRPRARLTARSSFASLMQAATASSPPTAARRRARGLTTAAPTHTSSSASHHATLDRYGRNANPIVNQLGRSVPNAAVVVLDPEESDPGALHGSLQSLEAGVRQGNPPADASNQDESAAAKPRVRRRRLMSLPNEAARNVIHYHHHQNRSQRQHDHQHSQHHLQPPPHSGQDSAAQSLGDAEAVDMTAASRDVGHARRHSWQLHSSAIFNRPPPIGVHAGEGVDFDDDDDDSGDYDDDEEEGNYDASSTAGLQDSFEAEKKSSTGGDPESLGAAMATMSSAAQNMPSSTPRRGQRSRWQLGSVTSNADIPEPESWRRAIAEEASEKGSGQRTSRSPRTPRTPRVPRTPTTPLDMRSDRWPGPINSSEAEMHEPGHTAEKPAADSLQPVHRRKSHGAAASGSNGEKAGKGRASQQHHGSHHHKHPKNSLWTRRGLLSVLLYGTINAVLLIPTLISFSSIIFRHIFFKTAMPYLIKLVCGLWFGRKGCWQTSDIC